MLSLIRNKRGSDFWTNNGTDFAFGWTLPQSPLPNFADSLPVRNHLKAELDGFLTPPMEESPSNLFHLLLLFKDIRASIQYD